MSEKSNWIYEFDYIRTIAILAVIFSHGYGIFGGADSFPKLQPLIVLLGGFGVILFFFVSGFLISKIEPDSFKSVIYNLKDRIIRIVPLYWSALAVTAILVFFNMYQGFWIRNFGRYNILINGAFLVNFTPMYDIPPFWFVNSLVLFSFTFLIIRYRFKNPFYFAFASLVTYFVFQTLQTAGIIWAADSFFYFIGGSLLGILYNAKAFSLRKIRSVHPIISLISEASYSIYLFHLIIFGAIVKLLALFNVTNFFERITIAVILTIVICVLIQKGYDRILILYSTFLNILRFNIMSKIG